MYKFSTKSREQLLTAHKDLQSLFKEVIKGYDCTVIIGHRTEEEQNEAFRTNHSKLKFPESKHNSSPSMAVDVAPYPIDWTNTEAFYHFGGYVKGVADQMGIQVRWGGDWDDDNDLHDQTFMDLVHWELVTD